MAFSQCPFTPAAQGAARCRVSGSIEIAPPLPVAASQIRTLVWSWAGSPSPGGELHDLLWLRETDILIFAFSNLFQLGGRWLL